MRLAVVVAEYNCWGDRSVDVVDGCIGWDGSAVDHVHEQYKTGDASNAVTPTNSSNILLYQDEAERMLQEGLQRHLLQNI